MLTTRDRVQRVVNEFASFYRERLAAYAALGRFPVNGSVEIRIIGLDDPADAELDGARAPLLPALRQSETHPEWDTAVWLDVLTLPGRRTRRRSCGSWSSSCCVRTTGSTR